MLTNSKNHASHSSTIREQSRARSLNDVRFREKEVFPSLEVVSQEQKAVGKTSNMSLSSNGNFVESEDDSSSFGGSRETTTRPQLMFTLRQSFRLAKSRRHVLNTENADEKLAQDYDNGITENPIDCDALMMALDECEQELEECRKGLKKARRKNKELLEDLADQRRIVSNLEDSYAKVKLELAEAKTNEDALLVATQQALADRDIMILDLARERDELVAELKLVTQQRNELAGKTSVLEECLVAKDRGLLTVVAENETLKHELIMVKQKLQNANHTVEMLDMPHMESLPIPSHPPTTKVTVSNRWTKGFRNPLKRWQAHKHTDELSIARTDDSSTVPSEEDYFQ